MSLHSDDMLQMISLEGLDFKHFQLQKGIAKNIHCLLFDQAHLYLLQPKKIYYYSMGNFSALPKQIELIDGKQSPILQEFCYLMSSTILIAAKDYLQIWKIDLEKSTGIFI
jgi:hypothetical protein